VQALLHGIGAALAGRAGIRLAAKLAMNVSRNTLLRLLRHAPEPTLTAAPRVLGVDDFALRKGQVYATILLDMQTRQRVDVLPKPAQPSPPVPLPLTEPLKAVPAKEIRLVTRTRERYAPRYRGARLPAR
jgi:hypothetical protein